MPKDSGTDVVFDDVAEVEVQVVGGDVSVTTAPGPARVQADVLQGPPLEIEMTGRVLRVVHRPERVSGLVVGPKAVVRVVAPAEVRVAVRTVSADVFIAGETTDAEATTVSGRITASAVVGASSFRTVSGDVEIESASGQLEATSVSGSITVARSELTSVAARTVSGDTTLDLAAGGAVPTIACVSVSGDVTIGLAPEAAFHLTASTISGRLDTSFPSDGLDGTRRRLSGQVGAGGPDLTVRTTSGDVAVLRREPADVLAPAE